MSYEVTVLRPRRSLVGWYSWPIGDKRYATIWLDVCPRDPPWRCNIGGCGGTDLRPVPHFSTLLSCGGLDADHLGLCWIEPEGTILQLPHAPIHPQLLRLLMGDNLHRDLWRVERKADRERMRFECERVDPATGKVLARVENHRVLELF